MCALQDISKPSDPRARTRLQSITKCKATRWPRGAAAPGAREACCKTGTLRCGQQADVRTGNMSHLMPNGQDFFTLLKKQLGKLDQETKP